MSRSLVLFLIFEVFLHNVWSLSEGTSEPVKSFSIDFTASGNSSLPGQYSCNGYTCGSNTESCCDSSAAPCCALYAYDATCCPDACYAEGTVCCGTYGCYSGTTCCGGSCCNYGYYCTSYLTCSYDYSSSSTTFSSIFFVAIFVPAVFVLIVVCVIVGAVGYRRRWYRWNNSYVVVADQPYNAPQVVYAQPPQYQYNGMPPAYSASYAPQYPVQYAQAQPPKK